MRKKYDFSKARKNPFAAQLNEQITFADLENSQHISSSALVDQVPKTGEHSRKKQLPHDKKELA